jgi:hypothetical protein
MIRDVEGPERVLLKISKLKDFKEAKAKNYFNGDAMIKMVFHRFINFKHFSLSYYG